MNGTNRKEERLDGRRAMAEGVSRLIGLLARDLRVLSPGLDGDIYAQPKVLEHLRRLAIAQPPARMRFIVGSKVRPNASTQGLVELARRMSSLVSIRHLPHIRNEDRRDVLIVDERCLLMRYTPESRESRIAHDPAQARQAAAEFDRLWEEATPAPEFRSLHI